MKISQASYQKRIAGLAADLEQRHVGALILEPGSNFRYLAGLSLWRSERIIAAILLPQGGLHLIAPTFEKERLEQAPAPAQVHTWKEDEDPFGLISRVVRSAGDQPTTIAVGPTTRFWVVERVRRELHGWDIVDAAPLIEGARLLKDPEEIRSIRAACKKTLATMASIRKLARVGMTESDLAQRIGGGLVQFGKSSALPHGGPSKRKLKRPDVILVDTGTTVDGYWSDLTRTFFLGKETRKFKEVYKIVADAHAAAIAAVAPGVECQAVDAAARKVIEDAGYGERFIHRTGHGLGLDGHEPPYLVKGNTTKLQAGMVVTIEPGIYIPGVFGVRIEDDVVVTPTGRKVLSQER
jgi:Xaa-Pro dipeptidase